MRDDRQRLLDIYEAIQRIEKYAGRGREAFERDELVQNWILHHRLSARHPVRSLPVSENSTPKLPGRRSSERGISWSMTTSELMWP